MATTSNWTVIFADKIIINQGVKNSAGQPQPYTIDDDSFWGQSKFSNVWAIQYVKDNLDYNDTVEYRDGTPHKPWNDSGLGDFTTQFIDKWDAKHLVALQATWDADNVDGETSDEKIARLGARPTSYSSY